MTKMDLKGIAWIGNMYEKLEAICVDAEEMIYQDTAQYVEDQVQTVGACFKKFYSDVVEELLPLSCTGFKPENPIIRLVHCDDTVKPKCDVKREHARFEVNPLIKDLSIHPQLDKQAGDETNPVMNHISEPPSEETAKGEWSDVGWDQTNNAELKTARRKTSEDKILPASRVNTSKSKDYGKAFMCNILVNEAAKSDREGFCSNLAVVSELKVGAVSTGSRSLTLDSGDLETKMEMTIPSNRDLSSELNVLEDIEVDATVNKNMQDSKVDEEIFVPQGTSSCSKEVKSDADADEDVGAVAEHFHKANLEESCVLVAKIEDWSMPPPQGRRRSYKIRDAISHRMWSRSKQQHRSEVDKENRKCLPKDSGKKSFKPLDSCDSEWELL